MCTRTVFCTWPKTGWGHTRIGLTATKKVGHAVQRNRARRVMRAALSEHLAQNIGGYDIILVARGQTPHPEKAPSSAKRWASCLPKAGLPDKAAPRPAAPAGMIKNVLIALLRGYKRYISPHLGHHCRFVPTCSEYAMQALATHGLCKGLLLTVWRLLRCQPFAKSAMIRCRKRVGGSTLREG